jgi:hypothetical protein
MGGRISLLDDDSPNFHVISFPLCCL